MTYRDEPKHSRRDRIRLRVGDTDENQSLIDDEKLDFYVKEQEFDEFTAVPSLSKNTRQPVPGSAKRPRGGIT